MFTSIGETMSASSSSAAAHALLIALGIEPTAATSTNTPSLANLLEGSGYGVRTHPLIAHELVEDDDQVGYLLEWDDGRIVAVLGAGDGALLLAEDGAALRPLEPTDRDGATRAYVIYEKEYELAQLRPYLSRHKGHLFEIFACGFVVNLFALCLPLFSSFVYDKILGNGITDTMWALVIGLGLVIVVEFSIRLIRIIIAERFAKGTETDIDHHIFHGLLNTRANAIPSIGEVLEKYKQTLYYRDFLSSSYLLALADLPFLLLFALAILIAAGPLVLVGLTCGVLTLIAQAICTAPLFDYDKQTRQAGERRMALMTDVLASRDAVIGASLRNDLMRRWRKASLAATQAASQVRFWRGMGQSLTSSLSFISYIGVLVGGVYLIEDHALTSGGLLAATMLTSRMLASFGSASTLVVRYHEFRTALREMNRLFPASAAAPKTNHGALNGTIQLNNITCNMGHGGHPVLSKINLMIKPGEMVGIAGAPGAGKTTLLRLITGLMHPDEGQVLIDHVPLTDLSLEDITQTIGFKPQELCLMEGTIEQNVRAGRASLTPEMRTALLESSGLAHSFTEQGLSWNTEVGPRGMNLSGGQRQLVALARAMFGAPPLLILDEPTNGLDAPLEAHVAEQILKRKGKSTILVSTHSRNLLSICDRIIVVGQSRLLADGPREKILV